jgi:ribonuclease J
VVGDGLAGGVAVAAGVGLGAGEGAGDAVAAGDGVVVAVVAISRQTGALAGEPEMVARGFVVNEGEGESLFKDAGGVIAECIQASSVEERGDQGLMTEKLRVELRRFFKKRSGRRPLVLPVLMEI